MELRPYPASVQNLRRSTRFRKNQSPFSEYMVEETKDLQYEVMMDDDHAPSLSEDDTTNDAGEVDFNLAAKNCTVLLNRIDPEEDYEKKEDEEKYIRKTGKLQPASRIPAFHKTVAKKRPIAGSQSSDPPAPTLLKKDMPNQTASTNRSAETTSRSKLPSIRETGLPFPSVRLTRINPEMDSHIVSSSEQHTTPQDLKESDGDVEKPPPMVPTPRPALRMKAEDPNYPEEYAYEMSFTAAETAPMPMDDRNVVCSQAPHEEKFEDEDDEEAILKQADNELETCYNEHPFEAESMEFQFVQEDTYQLNEFQKPSVKTESFSESEIVTGKNQDELARKERSSGKRSKDLPKSANFDTPAHSSRIVSPKTTISSQSNKTSRCWGFVVFCLFPSTLLVIGGFGQHVWHYGMPVSVSQLMGQLELHWLEGLWVPHQPCSSDCRVSLVESIPEGLIYSSGSTSLPSISETWINLLTRANISVDIAAFYFTLRDSVIGLSEPSAAQGKEVFKQLMELQSKGVKLNIAVNGPQNNTQDTADLARKGAEVREVDLQSVTGGIIHTKLWVVDRKNLYLGSANMDWRSLTQVKELGVSMEDCSCLAQDASRIFGVYWNIGAQKNGSLPPFWPARYTALSSSEHPLNLKLNGVSARVYLSSSPPQISAYGRSDDLASILSVITDAQTFVYISVMDYLPMSEFTEPRRFWPAINTAIQAAACSKGVQVNLLVSCWPHSPGSMFIFLQSLAVLKRLPLGCNINVKVFHVPSTPDQRKIPFSRVNHAKYMVTDRVVYIGTSNWSENYFTQTAGVGLVVNQTDSLVGEGQRSLQSQLEEVFLRDWTSKYASSLSMDDDKHCSR
ncbi:hypothetical protein UPYG_G00209520 [Umbra pygmaea]|uniref:PLD phosphodiesterase domain-containing protein n=1 Tax=Umbra pygmaea TaxID=75934 RepID=A0ABD0WP96_UMBPY